MNTPTPETVMAVLLVHLRAVYALAGAAGAVTAFAQLETSIDPVDTLKALAVQRLNARFPSLEPWDTVMITEIARRELLRAGRTASDDDVVKHVFELAWEQLEARLASTAVPS